uniref:Stereocilin n=1 Tax=Oryzias latipes TaxID=8090 RepID=A0A3P9LWU6_ORYLA
DRGDAILKEIISKLSKGNGLSPNRSPLNKDSDPNRGQSMPTWMRNIVGSLKTLFPSKNRPSLNKPIDRHRLSGFLYNISLYLQEMGAELEEAPGEEDEVQLWEKVLHFFLQSEGSAALNQWNGRVPPRPSIRLQDWFLSLRGSPHWDWLLGLLQSVITLSERLPQKSILTFLSQNWRTISAVLETVLQALVSGTYGQASAGLQGFICALKGQNDCEFSVSWLQELLQFLETRNWKPVVSLHPSREASGNTKGLGTIGRFRPFSLPPEALRQDLLSGNASVDKMMVTEDEADFMQSLLLQVLSRSGGGGGERGGHLAKRNLALVRSLDGLRRGLLHRVGSSVYGNLRKKVSQVTMVLLDDVSSLVDGKQQNTHGRCSVDLRHLILGIRHNVMWNTQALGITSQSRPGSLPFLSCPSTSEEEHQSQPAQARSPTRPASFQKSKRLLKLPAAPRSKFRDSSIKQTEMEHSASAEILEAACNESIPGLTGVSNFTVFLYCKLFDGENGSVNPDMAHMGLDLHAACTNAAWYLSAAEEDFFWVHVCSEFFAYEFNNTVCANSSFWLQRAHRKEYPFFNLTSIAELCVQLSSETPVSSGLSGNCLDQLGSSPLSAEIFRHCFLPNISVLISSLCSKEYFDYQQLQDSWAAAYCSKTHNFSHDDTIMETCQYKKWTVQHFINSTLQELCTQKEGLKEYICLNATLYQDLLKLKIQFADFCADLHAEQESKKCFLQRVFDMLPAPYDFDTSQLCVDPAPLLTNLLHKLSVCEVEGGKQQSFLVVLGYVLRVLDFMVGLSSGLDEGEGEARQGLGQAILLSSLLENSSWASLQPEASMSVLHTVGVFLRREQNATLKEDLLSCFSQPVLWDLIQQDDNSSALRVLLQEYLQMPRDSIRTLVMSAEKDAVKRFISHMHQSWDQLQVETSQVSQKEQQAMETMTAAFIHKFPRVTPELFVDLSQFIPFMSVSDIMSFPASLIVNDSRLTAIRDHSSEMKLPQKKAFVKRLLQSQAVGDVPTWPPYFLNSILPLLPYLPVSHFQQLTPQQQLSPVVELLGNSSLDIVRGRHVLRTLFSKRKNLTGDDIALGVLACYLDPADLGSYLQDSEVSFALWQQLSQCMSEGLISSSGRLSSWLIPAVQTLNISTMASPQLSALSGLLPHLGAPFLLSLPTQQILEILSKPALHKYSPAQAFQILSKMSMEANFDLGQITGGMSCSLLRLWKNDTDLPELLQFVSELPGGTRLSLQRKCIVEELRKQPAIDLNNLSAGFAATLVTMMEDLSNASVRAILDYIKTNFIDFLKLPHYKQTYLAERAITELSDPSKWHVGDVEHLGRLMFALSTKQINSIPKKDIVEQILVGQKRWKDSEVGRVCVIQPTPSCADIRGTFPSAWTSTQLSRMSEKELRECVEVFGQDSSLSSVQRRALWIRLRQNPGRELRTDQVLALGSLVTEMGDRELQDSGLTDMTVLAHLMRAVVLNVMRKRRLKVEQLTDVDLATFGHLICGLYPSEMKRLNSYNLVAVMFLREMSLPCTEQQMEALTSCLSRPEAFGPVSAWGPEIFTEIGTLAGLPDIVLSALLQEQVEGITPEAITMMSPKKMAQVVFSAVQLSWLSVEQAWAVTQEQWAELDTEQRHALTLARYEGDVLLELR